VSPRFINNVVEWSVMVSGQCLVVSVLLRVTNNAV